MCCIKILEQSINIVWELLNSVFRLQRYLLLKSSKSKRIFFLILRFKFVMPSFNSYVNMVASVYERQPHNSTFFPLSHLFIVNNSLFFFFWIIVTIFQNKFLTDVKWWETCQSLTVNIRVIFNFGDLCMMS